jgi:predicted nucleic acid-binding protein
MMICVDASVAVKWMTFEALTPNARALYVTALENDEPLVAPSLLVMEVNDALLKHTRSPLAISAAEAVRLLMILESMEIRLVEPPTLHQHALSLAITFRLPAVYDAYYLALAIEAQCPFWTDDQRLLRTLNGQLPFVHWIGDFPL